MMELNHKQVQRSKDGSKTRKGGWHLMVSGSCIRKRGRKERERDREEREEIKKIIERNKGKVDD